MKILLFLLVYLLVFPKILFAQIYKWEDNKGVIHFSENPPLEKFKEKNQHALDKDSNYQYEKTYEEYEKEKLKNLEKNLGKRFIVIPKEQFYEKAEFLDGVGGRQFSVKAREAFTILGIAEDKRIYQKYYQVKFDSGKIGYVSIGGFPNWEIFIRSGSIVPISDRAVTKESKAEITDRRSVPPKDMVYKAIELVKNHLTLLDPESGKMRSVEKRMTDAKTNYFPNMTWRYETTLIGKAKYRVTQYVDNGRGESFIRTWTVNISDNEVEPENLAAKKLYY